MVWPTMSLTGFLLTGDHLVKTDANRSMLWTKDHGPGHVIPVDQGDNFIEQLGQLDKERF